MAKQDQQAEELEQLRTQVSELKDLQSKLVSQLDRLNLSYQQQFALTQDLYQYIDKQINTLVEIRKRIPYDPAAFQKVQEQVSVLNQQILNQK